MLHQVGVSFDLYYDARKHKIKICVGEDSSFLVCATVSIGKYRRLRGAVSLSPSSADSNCNIAYTEWLEYFKIAL